MQYRTHHTTQHTPCCSMYHATHNHTSCTLVCCTSHTHTSRARARGGHVTHTSHVTPHTHITHAHTTGPRPTSYTPSCKSVAPRRRSSAIPVKNVRSCRSCRFWTVVILGVRGGMCCRGLLLVGRLGGWVGRGTCGGIRGRVGCGDDLARGCQPRPPHHLRRVIWFVRAPIPAGC